MLTTAQSPETPYVLCPVLSLNFLRAEELYTALKNAGYGDLVVETVNPSSLSAFVKEQISENGETLPEWLDGLVNVFEKTSISMRKSKK